MATTIGIVGGGLIGRLLGVELARTGWEVTLFDRGERSGRGSCTYVGAGMIAPSCELETAERDISSLGLQSLDLWPEILESLPAPVYFRREGSIVVAHPNDQHDLDRLKRRVRTASPHPEFMRELDESGIRACEPELAGRFHDGVYLSHEAHLDNRQVLQALAAALEASGATMRFDTEASMIAAHEVTVNGDQHRFDWVADCRGMGAREDLPDLRGVRGEILQVHAPEVSLSRPVRLMHPRYPIYVVPREDHVYVIGATALESEDFSPMSVRSALELLSAAYTLHTGFAEARILETATDCRPAFPDNHPQLRHQPGLLRINGLYRHGFLLAPSVVRAAKSLLDTGKAPDDVSEWVHEDQGSGRR